MSVGRGKQLHRLQVPDETTQRALDPMRDRLNEMGREIEGLGGLRDQVDGAVRFRLIPSIDSEQKNGDIVLADGDLVKLQHGLGKRLTGWMLVDLRGDGTTTGGVVRRVLNDGTSDADDARDLWLQADDFTSLITVRVYVT
jgi:hypothetical protein